MPFLQQILYQFWYFRKPPWDTGISPPELWEHIGTHPAGRALDLGCGTGTNAITLAQHGWQVTGVDFIGRPIRQAKRKAKQAGVQVDLRSGDVTRLEGIQPPFDLVLDIGCLHSLNSAQKSTYAQNLPGLLRAGGYYLLYAFLKPEDSAGTGLSPSEIEMLVGALRLIQRVDGLERGRAASAWFTFCR